MASGHDKWIRPLKDNAAGKVVADTAGTRWEWDSAQHDETSRLLQKLQNDELSIEQTDITPNPLRSRGRSAERPGREPSASKLLKKKPPSRDAGGGFNPYDSSGKSRRR